MLKQANKSCKYMKKIIAYAILLTMVVLPSSLLLDLSSASAATAGDLIKLQCAPTAGMSDPCRAVYYLGLGDKRYVFPNEKVYMSWYSDFSNIKIITEANMAAYGIGGNVTYRPGIKLVKLTTNPKVYAVDANGTLREVVSETIAIALYGSDWSRTVEDLPDTFWVNYTVGSPINSVSDYNKANTIASAPSISVDKSSSVTPTPTPTQVVKVDNSIELAAIESIKSKLVTGSNHLLTGAKYYGEGTTYLTNGNGAGASVKFYNAIEAYKLAYNTFLSIEKTSVNCCSQLIDQAKENYLQLTSYSKQSAEALKMFADGDTGTNGLDAGLDALKIAKEYEEKASKYGLSLLAGLHERTLVLNQ